MTRGLLAGSPPRGVRRAAWSVIPICAILLVARAVWTDAPSRALHAQEAEATDTDGDGLPDLLENVIGTDWNQRDSDGDGFDDGVEAARQSDPLRAGSVPGDADLTVGLHAYGADGYIHLVVALYCEDGRTDNKTIAMGALVNGELLGVPFAKMKKRQQNARRQLVDGQVTFTDLSFDPASVPRGGQISWFVAVGHEGSPKYASAAVADIFDHDGQPFVRLRRLPSVGFGTLPHGIGAVLHPIPPNGSAGVPVPGGSSKEICYRTSEFVGIDGAVVYREVTSADCVPEWDAYCFPGCANSLGTTYSSIDPVALVGG